MVRPSSSTSCLIVVSGGLALEANTESSNPITATSSGMRLPCACSTCNAPSAMMSAATNTASRSGALLSNTSMALAPLSGVKSAWVTRSAAIFASPSPRRNPLSRSAPTAMSFGPATVPIRLRPSDTRCRAASSPPVKLSASTKGTPVAPSGLPPTTTGRPISSSIGTSGSSPCRLTSNAPSTCPLLRYVTRSLVSEGWLIMSNSCMCRPASSAWMPRSTPAKNGSDSTRPDGSDTTSAMALARLPARARAAWFGA